MRVVGEVRWAGYWMTSLLQDSSRLHPGERRCQDEGEYLPQQLLYRCPLRPNAVDVEIRKKSRVCQFECKWDGRWNSQCIMCVGRRPRKVHFTSGLISLHHVNCYISMNHTSATIGGVIPQLVQYYNQPNLQRTWPAAPGHVNKTLIYYTALSPSHQFTNT